MSNILQKTIQRILLGVKPSKYLSIITTADYEKLLAAIKKQDAASTKEIDYNELIQDCGELFSSKFLKNLKGRSKQEKEKHQYQLTVIIRSLYFSAIAHNDKYDLRQSLELAYLLRGILSTSAQVYLTEIMIGQREFLHQLDLRIDELEEKISQMDELMQLIRSDEQAGYSDLWKYSPEQLTQLSIKLFQGKFIFSEQSFRQLFDGSWRHSETNAICNWEKKRTSLVFLFGLLYPNETDTDDMPFFSLLNQRFTINGASKSVKDFRETYRNIKAEFDKTESELKG